MKRYLKLAAIVAVTLSFVGGSVRHLMAADGGYSFKVHNTTKEKITKLLASEDGKNFGNFDLGSAGIPPGETVTLKWDKKTDNSGCEWYFKAVYAGGDETEAKKFDFCEEELELEF